MGQVELAPLGLNQTQAGIGPAWVEKGVSQENVAAEGEGAWEQTLPRIGIGSKGSCNTAIIPSTRSELGQFGQGDPCPGPNRLGQQVVLPKGVEWEGDVPG